MERFTISMDEELFEQFDKISSARGYDNRSEAIRDLVREYLEVSRLQKDNKGYCIATLTYIYNHHERDLAALVTSSHHEHHDITLSSMHVHMDHDNCLEVAILRGTIQDVRHFANKVIAKNGIRHGKLHIVPIEVSEFAHQHADNVHRHTHSSPRT
ncbi:transcriptional regulator, CopG family [Nitrosomonas sp. PY1]|uniref:nickel-responsive transcriptional regulator NikR n=1 Tax=Nitrosomonas sp. PY1 TaxID=1803906 RepID=UPI001FC8BF81|nr:nickel-responsive transcriptional regulator NikR [Nitrosomonas sp. PY1]GKS69087.1 transcriptional regulator, CopG family [Nitrosomonas sp. PY1]